MADESKADPSKLLRAGAEQAFDSLDERRAFAAVSESLLGCPEDPATLDRFQIERRVGSGGMGVVYAAFDPQLDRKVALKLLKPERSSAKDEERLVDEAKALARLNHPNIVGVHEIGTVGERVFIAMELVEGVPLSTWIRTQRTWQEVARVAIEAGRGLVAAHEAGLVHRDFKPANVMLRDDGRVVVLDFGLARVRDSVTTLGTTAHDAPDVLREDTQPSAVAGTPAYMAPEQHLGRAATPSSDQFSFCVSFHEALYGERPFEASTRIALLEAIDEGRFRPRPKSRRVSARLRRALMRGLRPAPADRWPSMEALITEIEAALGAPRRRKQLGLISGGVAVAAYIALGPMSGQAELCSQSASQLDGVWNEVIQGDLDTRYADSRAWPNLRARIETTTSGWTSRWLEICEATHVHGSQSPTLLDQRMACLDSDRVMLAAAVRQLQVGDRALMQRAARLSVFDRDGERCETQDLSRRIPVPVLGPKRERYDRQRSVAAEQYVLSAMGRDPNGPLAVLGGLEVGAESHPDVIRLVENARAEAYRQLDRNKEAYAAWSKAARAADAGGDDVSFVNIASVLAFMDVQDFDRLDAAEVWLERAQSRAETIELPYATRFVLALRAAVVTRYRGEPEAAAKDLETLLETERAHLTAGDEGTLHHNLGELYAVLRQLDKAAGQYRLAIDLRSTALGSDHRQVGQSRFLHSQLLIEQGKPDAAEAELEAAAKIFANVEGGAPERIMVEGSRSILAAMRGKLPLADKRMRTAIALAEKAWDPDHRDNATFFVNHGRILMELGKNEKTASEANDKFEEAASQVQRGIDVETKAAGPEYEGLADGLSLLAEIRLAQGRPEDAERLARRAASVAKAPEAKLEFEVMAMVWHAHAECDGVKATEELNAFLDAAADGTSPDTIERLRSGVTDLAGSVAEYPGCKIEPPL